MPCENEQQGVECDYPFCHCDLSDLEEPEADETEDLTDIFDRTSPADLDQFNGGGRYD